MRNSERTFRVDPTSVESFPYRLVLGWRNENGQTYDEIGFYLSEQEFGSLKKTVTGPGQRRGR